VFEVLFGTFSNNPFTLRALKAVKALTEFQDFMSGFKATVSEGVLRTFGWVARQLTPKPEQKEAIEDLENLAVIANSTLASDYARVGRLMYLEHVIDEKLRREVLAATGPKLPHHALMNKDTDVANPETRLAYKLACCLATDVTADVLSLYFSGATADDVVPVLRRYYRHPSQLLDVAAFRGSLGQAVESMYGLRWWQWADDDAGRIAVS
jgi:hypothetical protein